jgi:hypothetical protein
MLAVTAGAFMLVTWIATKVFPSLESQLAETGACF